MTTDRDDTESPPKIDWDHGENVAVWCYECGTVFTLSDASEFVGGTCQKCGEQLNVVSRFAR